MRRALLFDVVLRPRRKAFREHGSRWSGYSGTRLRGAERLPNMCTDTAGSENENQSGSTLIMVFRIEVIEAALSKSCEMLREADAVEPGDALIAIELMLCSDVRWSLLIGGA